ncbi:MAG TPA: oxidoreductase [Thermoanaerobaculia bacterium]|nr:oxidoreductase [Thermoanaerobaculia bacterium]
MQPRRALLLGATGLVGSELLRLLLDDPGFGPIRVLARRSTGVAHPKLEEHLLDLDRMNEHPELFAVDTIFCALGTTIKIAGSQDAFRRVDHDYPIAAAKLGLAQGARHYLLVSSLGANANSRIFYNRVKGEVERDLSALPYPSITIARPSLLLGPRTEFRLGERVAARFGWLMPPGLRPIEARDVARALVAAAMVAGGRQQASGVHILESRAMRTWR